MKSGENDESEIKRQTNPPRSRLVLVIEDSPTQAMIIQQFLIRIGLEVLCATSGQTGIHLVQSTDPALVLLDVQLPDMSGFQVCEQLKKDPETAEIPVIMFTRNDSIEAVQQGLGSGAVDYIPKDAFAMAVLLETLRQMGLVDGSQHTFDFRS